MVEQDAIALQMHCNFPGTNFYAVDEFCDRVLQALLGRAHREYRLVHVDYTLVTQ
jgi:hypothetical protein